MKITGEGRIAAPIGAVWHVLNNADLLWVCIPGCQSLEPVGDGEFPDGRGQTAPAELTAQTVMAISCAALLESVLQSLWRPISTVSLESAARSVPTGAARSS